MRVETKIKENPWWDEWGRHGFIIGFILILVGVLTQIFEIPRIYNGATNVDVFTNQTDNLYLMSNYYNHWWPWTYPANLVGIFTFLAGLMGVLAGVRRSYTSIYGFFTMSVVSTGFAIYLLVYFAFIISFYRSLGKDHKNNRSQSETVSYALACTQLVVSIVNILVSITAATSAGLAMDLCVKKGVSYEIPIFHRL